jgi:hypothetical protein
MSSNQSMKYIVQSLTLFSFLSIYASDINKDQAASPCWFTNQSEEYPFTNVNMQQFFPRLTYEPNYDFVRSFSLFALLPMAVECTVIKLGFNVPFPALPIFLMGNLLNGVAHAIVSKYRFAAIIDRLIVPDYCLKDQKKIQSYLTHIQITPAKFPLCRCNEELQKLERKKDDEEQDYGFCHVLAPDAIKQNLHEKTALHASDAYYSVLMTMFFTYLASALFYRSLTAPLNINTILRINLAIWWNGYLLHSGNKKYQNELIQNVHELYENFVINVHNSQIETQQDMNHLLETSNNPKLHENFVIDVHNSQIETQQDMNHLLETSNNPKLHENFVIDVHNSQIKIQPNISHLLEMLHSPDSPDKIKQATIYARETLKNPASPDYYKLVNIFDCISAYLSLTTRQIQTFKKNLNDIHHNDTLD